MIRVAVFVAMMVIALAVLRLAPLVLVLVAAWQIGVWAAQLAYKLGSK